MAEIRLVYFDIRGLAEPIRWMLKISEVEFEDSRIPLDSWGSGRKRRSSPAEIVHPGAPRLSNPDILAGKMSNFIGQLPILHYDDFSITQTHAVMRFIAKKYGYVGETSEEEARAEEVAELIYDLRLCAVQFHGTNFQSKTPDVVRHTVFRDFKNEPDSSNKELMRKDLVEIYFPMYFNKFASLLDESKGSYVAGNSLTYADLALANFFNVVEELVDPNCLDNYPKLKALQEDVCNIPQVKAFLEEQKSTDKVQPIGG